MRARCGRGEGRGWLFLLMVLGAVAATAAAAAIAAAMAIAAVAAAAAGVAMTLGAPSVIGVTSSRPNLQKVKPPCFAKCNREVSGHRRECNSVPTAQRAHEVARAPA